jgi:hypothetical protein
VREGDKMRGATLQCVKKLGAKWDVSDNKAVSEIFYVTHTIEKENFLENYEREYKRLDVYAVN